MAQELGRRKRTARQETGKKKKKTGQESDREHLGQYEVFRESEEPGNGEVSENAVVGKSAS